MAIYLDRTYNLFEMANFADEFEPSIVEYLYAFTGTVPSWVTYYPVSAVPPFNAFNFPQFDIEIPEGTTGTYIFGVTQSKLSDASTLTGTITINVQAISGVVQSLPHCDKVNLVWLDPTGGWENYIFNGKTQTEQGKGTEATFLNSQGEKRYSRIDEVHQGLIVTTGKVALLNADFVADAFKAIQAYLWDGSTFTPILIDRQSFRKVRSGESFAEYEFAFVYAVEDVIQTQ